MQCVVNFDSTCAYELGGYDQFDINKLVGFSSGFDHHMDSARFGWRYSNSKIELIAYCYVNNRRICESICKIELNKNTLISIEDIGDFYDFKVITHVNRFHKRISKNTRSGKFKKGLKLWPYFGGNQTAPHDIQIKLEFWHET